MRQGGVLMNCRDCRDQPQKIVAKAHLPNKSNKTYHSYEVAEPPTVYCRSMYSSLETLDSLIPHYDMHSLLKLLCIKELGGRATPRVP